MSSTAAASRRDTPAARAALARRRQRAAQSLRPPPPTTTTTASSNTNITLKQAPLPPSRIPTLSGSPPKEARPPKLTVDTTPSVAAASGKMTQLTRRAHEKTKSPTGESVMDATHTTVALTTSTMSPERQTTPSYVTAATPQQALANSRQAAERASSVLNSVTSKSRYRSHHSPQKERIAPVTSTAPQAASPSRVVQPQQPPPPQQDILITSRQRRQALLESSSSRQQQQQQQQQQRLPATNEETAETTTLIGSRPAVKTMTNPRYLSSSPRSRKSPTTPTRPSAAASTADTTTATDSPLQARMAKLEVTAAAAAAASQRWTGHNRGGEESSPDRRTSPSGSPSRISAALATRRSSPRPSRFSPRRYPHESASPVAAAASHGLLPPPSPRNLAAMSAKSPRRPQQQHSFELEQPTLQQQQQFYRDPPPPPPPPPPQAPIQQQQQRQLPVRSRSPSPGRRTTASPWSENNNVPQQQMQRPKPTPLQTQASLEPPRGRSPMGHGHTHTNLQRRAMLHHHHNARSVSPSPRNYAEEARNSPGVERLSSFLLDTTDVSTIADMTIHQMETPRNANFSFVHQADSPTLGAQPLYSPHYQHTPQHEYQSQEASVDHMTLAATPSYEQTPTRKVYRPIEEFLEEEEDQATLDPAKIQTIDAACLQSGSKIVLRSYCRPTTVGVVGLPSKDDDKYRLADLTGVGLGRDEEALMIQKVVSTAHDERGITPNLRHGDTVMLYSTAAKGRALGSRKFVNSSGTAAKIQLGFFSPSSGGTNKSEIWTILKSRPDKEILVGRAALVAMQQKEHSSHNRESTTASSNTSSMLAPVRSGDPIVLRNCYNGGILSVDGDGKLILLTDSYQHHQHSDDPTLLGRLQNHDRLYPTPQDTFQMILSSIPPCPPWVASRSSDERIFLTGSYLLQPRRNQRSAEFESALFAGKGTASAILEASVRHVASDENLSPKTKERILLDEVIGSFLGLEGLHVRLKGARGHSSNVDHFEFQLFDADGVTFDVGLRNLVEQILPLSTSFVRVRNFVSARHPGYEYGRVMQAFCEALDALLQDYVYFVAQLEWELRKYSKTDTLTMKSLYFQVTPSLHSMSILEHATEAVCEAKGGELINALWSLEKRSYMGDSVAKKVLSILLDKASEPYMEIMSEWLQSGKLNDPYQEFMVQRGTQSRGPFDGDSWLDRFQINEDHVVQGVASNDWAKETILTTGKYWNAVHECHVDLKDLQSLATNRQAKIPKLPYNSDTSAMASYIDQRYQNASQVLVRILLDNFKLVESLQIMKRYFLIDQGDFLMHFMDAAEMELLKPVDDISLGRLQHWLNTSIQLTESHKEEIDPVSGARFNPSTCPLVPAGLRCRLSDETLVSHLDTLYGGGIADQGPVTPRRRAYGTNNHGPTGVEVFSIDFIRVPFPLSLLLSKKAMGDYQLLFRHLFFTKHVERRLIGVWRDHQLLKKLDVLRGLLGPTFLLRQRMLHFVQNFIYYMVFEVVEGHWMDMREALDKAGASRPPFEKPQTVDDLLQVHNAFLARTLEACLLTNSDLIRSLTKLLNTCLLFTDQMKRFMDTTKIYDDSINRAAEKRVVVQRNLNERGLTQTQQDKRALRKAFASAREERQTVQQRQTRRVGREVQSESYQRMVRRFEEVFNHDLANFMRQLNANTTSGVVANLGIRLDYNGYVTATIANLGN